MFSPFCREAEGTFLFTSPHKKDTYKKDTDL